MAPFGGHRSVASNRTGGLFEAWHADSQPQTPYAPLFPPQVHDDMSFGDMCETLKAYCNFLHSGMGGLDS
jgi:hypothetical protein